MTADDVFDVVIAVAYFVIPLELWYCYARFNTQHTFVSLATAALFSTFITCCGMTHLLSMLALPTAAGIAKGVTAVVSVATALAMLWIIPIVMQRTVGDASSAQQARFDAYSQAMVIALTHGTAADLVFNTAVDTLTALFPREYIGIDHIISEPAHRNSSAQSSVCSSFTHSNCPCPRPRDVIDLPICGGHVMILPRVLYQTNRRFFHKVTLQLQLQLQMQIGQV